MKLLYLNDIHDHNYTVTEMVSFLEKNKTFKLVIYSDTFFRSTIDAMHEHLEMAYIIEEILKFSDYTSFTTSEERYVKTTSLTLKSLDNHNLAETLIRVSILKAKETDPHPDDYENLISEIDDFESRLNELTFKFSDEIDDYFANYVNNGVYADGLCDDSDKVKYIDKQLSENPEYKFGFWRSHIPNIPLKSIFHSTYCWLINQEIDIEIILKNYSGIENDIEFEKANLISLDGYEVIINNYTAIDFRSLLNFETCISCINELISSFDISSKTDKEFEISKNTDIIKISYKGFYIIYFNFKVLRQNEIKYIYEYSYIINSNLSSLMGLAKDINCKWEEIDDDKFEELCYDIIYNDIRFDNQTIRKMGKSKSRDGGRDIEVYTKSLNNESQKFIIQCKYSKGTGSLGKRKVPDASNVIKEYNAAGYMIMTNLVIDSTLYDMLDGFLRSGTNTKINYSKFELERYLAQHPNLKKRYFKDI